MSCCNIFDYLNNKRNKTSSFDVNKNNGPEDFETYVQLIQPLEEIPEDGEVVRKSKTLIENNDNNENNSFKINNMESSIMSNMDLNEILEISDDPNLMKEGDYQPVINIK